MEKANKREEFSRVYVMSTFGDFGKDNSPFHALISQLCHFEENN